MNLPVSARPYRAHTEALSEHYPELAIDFSKQTIAHLLYDKTSSANLGAHSETVRSQLLTIQATRRMAYSQAQPFRFCQYHAPSKKKMVDESNLPRVTGDLVRTMAEMIDQDSSYLVGTLVNLELIFYPKHPLCRRGRHSNGIKMMKNV